MPESTKSPAEVKKQHSLFGSVLRRLEVLEDASFGLQRDFHLFQPSLCIGSQIVERSNIPAPPLDSLAHRDCISRSSGNAYKSFDGSRISQSIDGELLHVFRQRCDSEFVTVAIECLSINSPRDGYAANIHDEINGSDCLAGEAQAGILIAAALLPEHDDGHGHSHQYCEDAADRLHPCGSVARLQHVYGDAHRDPSCHAWTSATRAALARARGEQDGGGE